MLDHEAKIGAGPAGDRQDDANGEENPGHLAHVNDQNACSGLNRAVPK
jgi:hypothetical protein